MASLPYVSSPGNISKALNGIKAAALLERASQDFVKTVLKIPGSSGDQMTTFLKKLGLTAADAMPTELYRKFRNPTSSGSAVAEAIKRAYAPLYVRHEYTHELNESDLTGLVVEETGEAHDSNAVKLTVSCIKQLKTFATFGSIPEIAQPKPDRDPMPPANHQIQRKIDFKLGYTINLNLPATSDAAVFDAIFRSLKANLLREEDA